AVIWLHAGLYLHFAREELALEGGWLVHRLAGAMSRTVFASWFATARDRAAELEDVWVSGEGPLATLHLEMAHERISGVPAPVVAADLGAALLAEITCPPATTMCLADPPA